MEQESEKKKKVAPPVEEQKPETSEETPQFNVEEITAKIPKAFRGYVKPIVDYAQFQDARIKRLEEALNVLGVKLQPLIEVAKEARARQEAYANNPPQSQKGGGTVERLLSAAAEKALLGGGGVDEEMKKRYDKMMDLQFDRLQQDVSFSRTMENYIKSQFAGKLGKKLVESVE